MALEEAKGLIAQRDEMLREMERLQEYLGRPEVRSFRCVDAEGFPNPDTEMILAVRTARNRFAMLTNDLKALMLQIEQSLHRVHAEHRTKPAAAPPAAAAVPNLQQQQPQPQRAPGTTRTLVVDEVASGGPAERAGLQLHDVVVRFGTADVAAMLTAGADARTVLGAIADVVAASVGTEVAILVARASAIAAEQELRLTLIPQPWSGRGLLGCHLSLEMC